MTAKRKIDDVGNTQLEIVKWGMSTNVFRLAIFVLVLSMHPIGRGFLTGFGFKFPDEKKIEEAATEAKDSKSEIAVISDSLKEIRTDVASLKANNAILNSKVDTIDQTFRGFQIDFNKWKPQPNP